MACGQPVSAWWRTASCTSRASSGRCARAAAGVSALAESVYAFMAIRIGPTDVWNHTR